MTKSSPVTRAALVSSCQDQVRENELKTSVGVC